MATFSNNFDIQFIRTRHVHALAKANFPHRNVRRNMLAKNTRRFRIF